MAAMDHNTPGSGLTNEEHQVFGYLLRPADSYAPDGTYWADLPFSQRWSFVNKVNSEEMARERRDIGRMFKEDPLSPLGWYWRNSVIPGFGIFLEGYVLFSIGNLSSLYGKVWPTCWSTYKDCDQNWVAAVAYLQTIGIMVGQVMVGFLGDGVGRHWGLVQDALIMLLGLIMLIASWGTSLNGWVICYAWAGFVYGVGVGGEYPTTVTITMENAMASGAMNTKDDRLHRGRKVILAFLMQGWGQVGNQVLLIILLYIFNRGNGDPPYSMTGTQYIYRLSFAFPAIGTLWLAYYRSYKMKSADTHLAQQKAKSNVQGYNSKALQLVLVNYGGRLLATAGCWFCNDVFFYGNKLFQSQFINVVTDNPSSIITTWVWNLVNIAVSLSGYYCGALLVDYKFYGRNWMQQVGFLVCFLTFVIPAFNYAYYTSPAGIHSFQAMYFLSSFFNQFGPNVITFLVAGECFPIEVRATAHGFSAMVGKLGALVASVLYNYITIQQRFYVVPWFGLAGMILSLVWLPDTTGLDLREAERRWSCITAGRPQDYHGVAIHPRHLSLWERMFGIGKNYNAELDNRDKILDLHADWKIREAAKTEEGPQFGPDEYTDEVHAYFRRSHQNSPVLEPEQEKTSPIVI